MFGVAGSNGRTNLGLTNVCDNTSLTYSLTHSVHKHLLLFLLYFGVVVGTSGSKLGVAAVVDNESLKYNPHNQISATNFVWCLVLQTFQLQEIILLLMGSN